jgi:hypothetical protein
VSLLMQLSAGARGCPSLCSLVQELGGVSLLMQLSAGARGVSLLMQLSAGARGVSLPIA